MTDDMVVFEEQRPCNWADAFPWLAGASGVGAVDWWNEPIERGDAASRQTRVKRIATLAMERLTRWTIGEIFPGLPADIDVIGLDIPVRARNIFGKYGRSKPGRLQSTTLDDMLDWQNMGVGTADAILQALAEASTSNATATISAPVSNPIVSSGPRAKPEPPAWVAYLVDDFTTLATWYSTVGKVDQALLGGHCAAGMPDEIIKALHRIKSLRASGILSESEAECDVAARFDAALSVLDIRTAEVLGARLFADDPTTLDQLGQKYEVTRERIRQIEGKARGAIMTLISEEGPLAMAAESARGWRPKSGVKAA